MPYLCPSDEIPGDDFQCRQILIPNDPAILAAVKGALTPLLKVYNWEKTGTVEPADVVDAMHVMVFDFFDSGCLTMPEVEFSLAGCNLLWRYVGNETWTNLGDVCGADGETGECCVAYPGDEQPEPDEVNFDHLCAGVVGAITWSLAVCDNALDEAQLVVDLVKTVAAAIEAIVETLSGGFLELLPLDELAKFLLGVTQVIISQRRLETEDVDNIDSWTEALYCRVKTNGGKLLESEWDEWIEEDVKPLENDTYGDICRYSWLLKQMIGWQKFKAKYILYSYDEENDCELQGWCPDVWEHTWDFKIDDYSEVWSVQGGSWVSGVGYVGGEMVLSDPTRYAHWNYLFLALPDDIDMTLFVCKYSTTSFAGNQGTPTSAVRKYKAGTGYESFPVGSSSGWSMSPGVHTGKWQHNDGYEITDDWSIAVSLYGGFKDTSPPAGSSVISRVTVWGLGTDPF